MTEESKRTKLSAAWAFTKAASNTAGTVATSFMTAASGYYAQTIDTDPAGRTAGYLITGILGASAIRWGISAFDSIREFRRR